ncbi:VPLPA-CTERM sorting domain-containing protein [Dinoroseobacter sp. S76]|uniref:VPLPA-CTERM sorting domain-containing protein n=1 Tax=Dinoroseobacter sp. S76 TaxID=3415124 RepID=UPI003C7BDCC5
MKLLSVLATVVGLLLSQPALAKTYSFYVGGATVGVGGTISSDGTIGLAKATDSVEEFTLGFVFFGQPAGPGLSFDSSAVAAIFGDTTFLYTEDAIFIAAPNNGSPAPFADASDAENDYYLVGQALTVAPVPLPASLPLLAVAVGGLAVARRRRQQALA